VKGKTTELVKRSLVISGLGKRKQVEHGVREGEIFRAVKPLYLIL
jgi:hypothetical protein